PRPSRRRTLPGSPRGRPACSSGFRLWALGFRPGLTPGRPLGLGIWDLEIGICLLTVDVVHHVPEARADRTASIAFRTALAPARSRCASERRGSAAPTMFDRAWRAPS